jgi:hypothetical protein
VNDHAITDLWLDWRWKLFPESVSVARRTCRQGHDWDTHKRTITDRGRFFERCSECQRARQREKWQRNQAAKRKAVN